MKKQNDMFEKLNKYRLVANILLVIKQGEFGEDEDVVKEAISILHQTVFPEKD